MACSDDQQPDFKHFCRICKKGFMCGRALGGHMRAHGIGDETTNLDDDDIIPKDSEGSKKIYALRTNPNRFSRLCENCGKEFCSWKSFLEHGKCGSDDAESSLVWSPESEPKDEEYLHGVGSSGWSKRKRSFRVCQSDQQDEEDVALAKCLMALSNSMVDHPSELELNATTNKQEQTRFFPNFTKPPPDKAKGVVVATTTTPKGMFECKACKKVFNSHQALGGHRASHKNVKGCFAARNDHFDDNLEHKDNVINDVVKPIFPYQSDHGPSTGPDPRKSKVHKCSICNRIFASGQALGGHKRCHWLTSNYTTPDTTSINKINFHEHIEQLYQRALAVPKELELKLNLPASTTTTHRSLQNPARLEVSTEINLHAWSQENGDGDTKEDHKHQSNNSNGDQYHVNAASTMGNEDDEGQGKMKLAKLSELKEMNSSNGSPSSWLQVGIGSTTDMAPDP